MDLSQPPSTSWARDVSLRCLVRDAEGEAGGRLSVLHYRARQLFPMTAAMLAVAAQSPWKTLPSTARTGYSRK
jgi:hypothetical protein